MALVVADRARDRGVDAALVKSAETFAREHGCQFLEVTSNRRRKDAHAFYRSVGFLDGCETSGRFDREVP